MSKTYAYAIGTLFLLSLQIFSATTSFQFFTYVFGNVYIFGIIGFLLLDGAFIAWLAIRSQLAATRAQIAASTVGALVGFIGSSASTFLYMSLSAGESSISISAISLTFSVIGVIHIALGTLYSLTSSESVAAIHTANRKAEYAAKMEDIRLETDRQVMEQLERELPSLAAVSKDAIYMQLLTEYTNPLLAQNIVDGTADIKKGRNVCQFDDCHNSLEGKRRGTKYCSDSCKQAAYKARATD